MFGCCFDVGEGLIAFSVGHIFGLVEAGDGVANVRRVVERFLPLFEERVD